MVEEAEREKRCSWLPSENVGNIHAMQSVLAAFDEHGGVLRTIILPFGIHWTAQRS